MNIHYNQDYDKIMAIARISSEYKKHLKNPNYFYSLEPTENIYNWNFILIGPPDSLYEYGIFKGNITFPTNYPISPPVVKFTTKIVHPNIYSNGKICISILHEGIDQYNYEQKSERWNPSHGVESIMLSLLIMLSDPNDESPANVDIAKIFRQDFKKYKKMVYDLVLKTQL